MTPRFLFLFVVSCASSPSPKDAAIEVDYSTQLGVCVTTAKTLAESQACRCEVNKRFKRVCNPEVYGDAGHD